LKLSQPHAGQYVLFGLLQGVDDDDRIALELDNGERIGLDHAAIESARLVFESSVRQSPRERRGGAGKSASGIKPRRPQRTSR
jgi:hypothetical protein